MVVSFGLLTGHGQQQRDPSTYQELQSSQQMNVSVDDFGALGPGLGQGVSPVVGSVSSILQAVQSSQTAKGRRNCCVLHIKYFGPVLLTLIVAFGECE